MKFPNKYDICVKDSEYEKTAKTLNKYGNLLEDFLSQYILCLSNIAYSAIPSGKVHEAIVCFIAHLAPIEGVALETGQTLDKISNGYVAKIDKKDDFLYEMGGKHLRKFTEAEFNKLINMLKDDIWHNNFDWDGWKAFTWGFGAWVGGVKWDDVTDPKINIDDCHEKLLDYKDAEKETISNIFKGVQVADDTYKPQFQSCLDDLVRIKQYLDEATSLINPANGRFTVEDIQSSLGPLLSELMKYHNEMIEICAEDKDLSIGQIEDFASQPWAASYFSDYTWIFSDFEGSVGTIDTYMYALFEHYDVDKALIKEFFKNGKFDEDAFEKYLTKSELMDMLNEMAETYRYEGSEEQKLRSDCSLFIKYVKKYGDKWYEELKKAHLLDGRTKEAKEFKGMLSSLGNASKILSYGDKAIQFLTTCFTDYSLNNMILKSFIGNCSSDPIMKECALEIKDLYEKKMNALIKEAWGVAVDVGVDAGISALEKVGPMKIVALIETGIKITGDISGLGKQYKSLMNAFTNINIFYSAQDAYRNALEKVRNADKSSSNYPILIKQLRDCFELTKNAGVKAFKSMAGFATGDVKAYYEYCASVAEDATMNTHFSKKPINIMSYEKWSKA